MQEQARQDLELVRRLMVEARGVEVTHGPYFVLWGAVTAVGLVLTWLATAGPGGPAPMWTWLAVLVIGWSGSLLLARRPCPQGRRTTGARVLSSIWVGSGIVLTLVGLAGMLLPSVSHALISGLVAVIFGGGYWATSGVTGRAAERGYAVGWWIGGALMLWSPGSWTLLALAGMVVGLEVVPGLVLLRRSREAGTSS